MFAGPNGSGKSSLKTLLEPELLGIYLNPDDMEREMRASGRLDLNCYSLSATDFEAKAYFSDSAVLKKAGLTNPAEQVSVEEGCLFFPRSLMNSYAASAAADFLRQRLFELRSSFTLETVMSHPSKVALLQEAQQRGYRTYLYFIATDDPEINVSRVRSRVRTGGHPVPEDRIVKRYFRSLELLPEAILHTNRAYIFDNSAEGLECTWLAEITEGLEMESRTDQLPRWFRKAVWEKKSSG